MKSTFLLIINLSLCTMVFAQDPVSYGFRAGVISSGIRGNAPGNLTQLADQTGGYVQTSNRTGFFGGVNANIPIAENFSIEPGVYYSQKGYNLSGNFDLKGIEFLGVHARVGLQTQYIDVPVLLKADFNGFQLFAGPQLSYLAVANLKTTAGALGINFLNKSIDVSDQFNRWDAAITAGIGYRFANGFNISASYDYGLTKVDAHQNVAAFNRAIKVGIGINF